jgi:hypothetical protein
MEHSFIFFLRSLGDNCVLNVTKLPLYNAILLEDNCTKIRVLCDLSEHTSVNGNFLAFLEYIQGDFELDFKKVDLHQIIFSHTNTSTAFKFEADMLNVKDQPPVNLMFRGVKTPMHSVLAPTQTLRDIIIGKPRKSFEERVDKTSRRVLRLKKLNYTKSAIMHKLNLHAPWNQALAERIDHLFE